MFLIYNPTVKADREFDIEVDYNVFRKEDSGAGERYVTHTMPQRFNRAAMDAAFDPTTGPILAGQGILLSSFQEGEYRLGITVTDLMSQKSLSRDVTFTVLGS